MQVILFFGVLFSLSISQAIIFGADNRSDIVTHATKNRDLAPAISMSVGQPYVIPQSQQKFRLDFYPASDSANVGLCPEEKFSQQNANWLNCTGFMVTEEVMVTAGHCMIFNHSGTKPALVQDGTTSMCNDFDWVFDFKAGAQKQVSLVDYDLATQTAQCQKVIHAEITPDMLNSTGTFVGEYGLDFAIIKLDRPMKDRQPLRIATLAPKKNELVYAIGYPSGLPMKLAHNARVIEDHFKNFFTADLDISSGSSGGPVFNIKNEVIGIVVRASPVEDYIWDKKRDCATSYVCKKIGQGLCNAQNGGGGYPLGVHVHKMAPILAKLRELKILQ